MVENAHAHDLADLAQAAGDLDVLLGRSGIAGWVIVLCAQRIYVQRNEVSFSKAGLAAFGQAGFFT